MIIMILRASVLSADEKPENKVYDRIYTEDKEDVVLIQNHSVR